MIRFIDVYSLPRSGSNLFAAYMMLHTNIVSYNVAGGRHPLRANFGQKRYEVLSGPGIYKKNVDVLYRLRDELKFHFVGPKTTWLEQGVFRLLNAFTQKKPFIIILLRNPYAIASSMQSYQKTNPSHRNVWDMRKNKVREKFVVGYCKLLEKISHTVKSGGYIVDPYWFFKSEQLRVELFESLNLEYSKIGSIEKCRRGHKYEKCDGVYSCDCGQLEGFGGFKPQISVDPSRLLTNKEFLNTQECELLMEQMRSVLEPSIFDCFNINGVNDLSSLMECLAPELSHENL